jgi:hypothetical protein
MEKQREQEMDILKRRHAEEVMQLEEKQREREQWERALLERACQEYAHLTMSNEELRQMRNEFRNTERVVAIFGLPGQGKSSLTRQVLLSIGRSGARYVGSTVEGLLLFKLAARIGLFRFVTFPFRSRNYSSANRFGGEFRALLSTSPPRRSQRTLMKLTFATRGVGNPAAGSWG